VQEARPEVASTKDLLLYIDDVVSDVTFKQATGENSCWHSIQATRI